MSTTIRFEEVSRTGRKNLPCPSCGKKVRRQRTFTNTISPFNKDPETGLPRTRAQIWQKLGGEVAEWEQQAVTCLACGDGAA